MHLRKNIATPDRFDEVVFRNKRKDPTKPLYPKLLAAQVVPFSSTNKSAAFPSLSLTDGQGPQQSENLEIDSRKFSSGSEQRFISSKGLSTNNTFNHTLDLYKERQSNTGNEQIDNNNEPKSFTSAVDVCEICNKKIRTEWKSLPLAVQLYIFSTFLRHQQYPEVVATSLRLTHDELDDVKYQTNLRNIYPAPLENIWAYGAVSERLGPGIIDPEMIHEVMNYLLFASHYEITDEAGIKRGRTFLKELGFDSNIMDTFKRYDQAERMKQATVWGNPQSRPVLKRRRNSTSDAITVNVQRANAAGMSECALATAPASITVSGCTSGLSHHIHNSKLNGVPTLSKRLRLDIDDCGYASIAHGLRQGQRIHGTLSGLNVIPGNKARLLKTLFNNGTEIKIHANHNLKAVASFFVHAAFPASERIRLLESDPRYMSHLDHWLVYGNSWTFTHHWVEYGLVKQPADAAFDPHRTLLDGSSLQPIVLRALVDFHNIWVQQNAWKQGQPEDLTRRFDLLTESLMESYKPAPAGGSVAPTGRCVVERTGANKDVVFRAPRVMPLFKDSATHGKTTSAHTVVTGHNYGSPGPQPNETNISPPIEPFPHSSDVSEFVQRNLGSGKGLNQKQPQLCPPTINAPQRMTPNGRTIRHHTGDTTVAILTPDTSVRSLKRFTKPCPSRREFHYRAGQGDYSGLPSTSQILEPYQASLNVETSKAEVPRSLLAACPSIKAPSFSPISDQDQETLPVWARNKTRSEVQMSPAFPTPESKPRRLPFQRSAAAGFHENIFLQSILDAAAEEVVPTPDTPSAHSVSTRSNGAAEMTALSAIKRQYHEGSPDPSQLPSPIEQDSSLEEVSRLGYKSPLVKAPQQCDNHQDFHTQSGLTGGSSHGIDQSMKTSRVAKPCTVNETINNHKVHFPTCSRIQVNLPVYTSKLASPVPKPPVKPKVDTLVSAEPAKQQVKNVPSFSPGTKIDAASVGKETGFKPAVSRSSMRLNPYKSLTRKGEGSAPSMSPAKRLPETASHTTPRGSQKKSDPTIKEMVGPIKRATRSSSASATTFTTNATPNPNVTTNAALATTTTAVKKRRKDFGLTRSPYKKRDWTARARTGSSGIARDDPDAAESLVGRARMAGEKAGTAARKATQAKTARK